MLSMMRRLLIGGGLVVGVALAIGGCGSSPSASPVSENTVLVGAFDPAQTTAVQSEATVLTGVNSPLSEHAWVSFDYARHEMLVEWCDEGSALMNKEDVARQMRATNVFKNVRIEKQVQTGMGNC